MKILGIIILVLGLAITIITGLSFVTKEKVVDIGDMEIRRDKKHSLTWSPIAGVVVMVIGGGLIIWGFKKQ